MEEEFFRFQICESAYMMNSCPSLKCYDFAVPCMLGCSCSALIQLKLFTVPHEKNLSKCLIMHLYCYSLLLDGFDFDGY